MKLLFKIIRLHTHTHIAILAIAVSLGTALTVSVDRELCLHTMYRVVIY